MKKILMLLIFIICVNLYSEENIISANGQTIINFDMEKIKISDVRIDYSDPIPKIYGIELGMIVDEKIYYFKDLNPKVSYVEGTNIIKIDTEVHNMKISTQIFTPYEKENKYLYIINDLDTKSVLRSREVEFFYFIDSKNYASNIYSNEEDNYFTEDDLGIKYFYNETKLYISPNLNLKNLKNKKVDRFKEKKIGEKLLLTSNMGSIGKYASKRDLILIDLNPEKELVEQELIGGELSGFVKKIRYSKLKFKEVDFDSVIVHELDKWNYWNRNVDLYEFDESIRKIILQNLVIIKMSQMENGSIISDLGKRGKEVNIEDMLVTLDALLNAGHYEEVKKGLDFIINAKTYKLEEKIGQDYIVANVGYICGTNEEKIESDNLGNLISYYSPAYFLRVFTKYIKKTGDYTILSKDFVKITDKVTELLWRKIDKNNLIEADTLRDGFGWKKRKHFINTQYMSYMALKEFAEQIKGVLDDNLYNRYIEGAKQIKIASNQNFILDGVLVDSLEDKIYNTRNVECLREDFINLKTVKIKTFAKYIFGFKSKDLEGYSSIQNDDTEFLDVDIDIAITAYNLKLKDHAERLFKRINNVASNNNNFIPEYIKNDGKKLKYGKRGIPVILSAKYINLIYSRREYEASK